ncbi:MAG: hypothetical protein ACXU60_11375 [Croceibacterium sp.]
MARTTEEQRETVRNDADIERDEDGAGYAGTDPAPMLAAIADSHSTETSID